MPVGQDLILILVIVLVILLFWRGPKVLPKLGESLGQSISGFRKATKDAEPEDKVAVAEVTASPVAAPATPVAAPATPAAAPAMPVAAPGPPAAADPPADAGEGEPRA